MGFFRDLMRRKSGQPPAAVAAAEAIIVKKLETTLEPITINLNSQQFECNSQGRWCAAGGMQAEVVRLRREKLSLEKEILRYARQEQEMKQLKEKLNLMDLKYKVLVEMWTQNKVNQSDREDDDCPEDLDREDKSPEEDLNRKNSKFIWPRERYS